MMESLILFVFGGGWLLLAVLALRYGRDSRDGIEAPPQGPLWGRPNDRGGQARRDATPDPVLWATLVPSQSARMPEVVKTDRATMAA